MATRPQPPLLEVADRAGLRAWLTENHATSTGVRLAIGKKGGTATELNYEDAVLEAVAFGWIDGKAQRLDEHRYTVLFTPRRSGGTWAKSNKARVEHLVTAGLMTPAGMAAVEAAKADGSWNTLTDADDRVVPDDLAAALTAAKATAGFEALPASKQGVALYWIATAKRPETRAKRIAETVEAAKHAPTYPAAAPSTCRASPTRESAAGV
jgi:uncharacterized protein YdeI (YjbR/CyaY-like superfamily)